MRKKTLVQKICALALTFAMVTGPVSYARAEEPSPQNAKRQWYRKHLKWMVWYRKAQKD